MPWDPPRNQPITVRIEGALWLPIFSTVERLKEQMAAAGCVFSIKQIDDANDFLKSTVEQGIAVCLDLHHVDGKVRFARIATEI